MSPDGPAPTARQAAAARQAPAARPRAAVPGRAPAPGLPEGVGRTVSALLPRLVLLGGAVLGVVAQTAGRDLPPAAVLPVLLALLAAWRPSLPGAWLAVAGLMVLAVVGASADAAGAAASVVPSGSTVPSGSAGARTAVTVLAVHLVHVAAALVAVLPAGSRVETAALLPTWRRFLLVQAVSQAVLAAALALR